LASHGFGVFSEQRQPDEDKIQREMEKMRSSK
jgi:hypothetical protein